MARRAGPPKERRHIHLTQGSWDKLTEWYSPQGITPSAVIDKLVTFHIKRVEEKMNLGSKPKAQTEVEDVNTEELDLSEAGDD